jgi:hypothetical protein
MRLAHICIKTLWFPVADYIAVKPALRAVTKCSLVPMIITIKYPVTTVLAILLLVGGIVILVRKRTLLLK